MLSSEVIKYIDKSVLCWLATVDENRQPNVSPKEVFTYHNDDIIIANIASPNTVKNIQHNPKICVSFIEIFIQKGFQIKGTAKIISNKLPEFEPLEAELLKITKGKFPFQSITKIKVNSIKPIVAPSYLLYPETTEASQIESAKKRYNSL